MWGAFALAEGLLDVEGLVSAKGVLDVGGEGVLI